MKDGGARFLQERNEPSMFPDGIIEIRSTKAAELTPFAVDGLRASERLRRTFDDHGPQRRDHALRAEGEGHRTTSCRGLAELSAFDQPLQQVHCFRRTDKHAFREANA